VLACSGGSLEEWISGLRLSKPEGYGRGETWDVECGRSLVNDDADDALSVLRQRVAGTMRNMWVGQLTGGRRGWFWGRTMVRTVEFYCACFCRSLITLLKRQLGFAVESFKVNSFYLFLLLKFRSGTLKELSNVNLGIVDAARCWGSFFAGSNKGELNN
jgi:hypothetical protein